MPEEITALEESEEVMTELAQVVSQISWPGAIVMVAALAAVAYIAGVFIKSLLK